jgi:hypothetical protein
MSRGHWGIADMFGSASVAWFTVMICAIGLGAAIVSATLASTPPVDPSFAEIVRRPASTESRRSFVPLRADVAPLFFQPGKGPRADLVSSPEAPTPAPHRVMIASDQGEGDTHSASSVRRRWKRNTWHH